MKKPKNGQLVYSTESGKICPGCEQAIANCSCKKTASLQKAGDGCVRVSRETKGRKGSGVTLVSGLALNSEELKILSKKLKQLCGSGGAVKNGIIEIQGDKREMIVAWLIKEGFPAKRAGG